MDLSSVVASGFVRSFPYRLVQLRGRAVGQVPEGSWWRGSRSWWRRARSATSSRSFAWPPCPRVSGCSSELAPGLEAVSIQGKGQGQLEQGQAKGQELAHRPGLEAVSIQGKGQGQLEQGQAKGQELAHRPGLEAVSIQGKGQGQLEQGQAKGQELAHRPGVGEHEESCSSGSELSGVRGNGVRIHLVAELSWQLYSLVVVSVVVVRLLDLNPWEAGIQSQSRGRDQSIPQGLIFTNLLSREGGGIARMLSLVISQVYGTMCTPEVVSSSNFRLHESDAPFGKGWC